MTGVGGDTGRGLRVAARGFRTWFRFGWWIGIGVILAGLGAAIWKTTSDYTNHDWHVFGVYALSEFMLAADFKPDRTKNIRDVDGNVLVMTLDTVTRHPEILDFRNRLLGDAVDAALLGGGICAGLAAAVLFGLHLLGRRLGRGKRLRGGELASAKELRRRTLPWWRRPLLRNRPPEAQPYRIARIPWPKGAERLHTIVSGTTGSGKTVLISDLVEQIRSRGERCVIYDKMGSYTETFFDDRRDVLLNPLDRRAPRWSPFLEARTARDFDTMANALIPRQKDAADPFWITAARQLFSRGAAVLWQRGESRNRVLVDLLLKTELSELAEAMEGTVTQSIVDPANPKTALSVRAMLTANIGAVDLLPDEGEPFSIREWIEREEGGGFLFLTSRGDQHASLRGLISTWLEIAVNALLSLPRGDSRRTWVILDELPTLHQLPSLKSGLAESRQFGGCFVLGVQVFSALRDLYGRDGAETISGLCGTRVVLAAPDKDTSEWSAESLGRVEVETLSEGVSYETAHGGVTLSTRREERPLVLPSEVSRLENLSGYIKLPGAWPVAKIRLKYRKWDVVAARFVPRPDDSHDPSRAGGATARLTHLAGDGAVPASDARNSGTPCTATVEPAPETAVGPAERGAGAAQASVAESPASATAAGGAADVANEGRDASVPEAAEGVHVGKFPSDADCDAQNGPGRLPQGATSADFDGNGAASSSDEGAGRAVTGTPAQEEETQPPWVTF